MISLTEDDIVCFVGDTHGYISQWISTLQYLQEFEERTGLKVPVLVQLGDFGYWEHSHTPDEYRDLLQINFHPLDLASRGVGPAYLDCLDALLRNSNRTVVWLRGNHECYPLLKKWYGPGGKKHQLTPEGFWKVREKILFAPDGHTWEWAGVKFLSVGGAASVDRLSREEGMQRSKDNGITTEVEGVRVYESWWPDEILSEEAAQTCVQAGRVDVVVAHDVPNDVDMNFQFQLAGRGSILIHPETEENREKLQRITEATKPKWWIHGHWHLSYSHKTPQTTYIGLDCDGRHQTELRQLSSLR